MAAVLACGEGAVLSHTSAAELWGIRRRVRRLSDAGGTRRTGPVHVTVPSTAGKRKRHGIVLHRSTTLIARHCTRRDGIPVTTPARTLSDLRPLLSPAQFAAAIREAEFLRLPIADVQAGWRRRRPRTRSELEARFMALCRRHRLPRPEVNVAIDGYEVDFLWREQRLIVEVDGWDSHRTRSAFEEDRARDARLAAARLRGGPLHLAPGHRRSTRRAQRRSARFSNGRLEAVPGALAAAGAARAARPLLASRDRSRRAASSAVAPVGAVASVGAVRLSPLSDRSLRSLPLRADRCAAARAVRWRSVRARLAGGPLLLAHLGLAVGADAPLRIERLVALAARDCAGGARSSGSADSCARSGTRSAGTSSRSAAGARARRLAAPARAPRGPPGTPAGAGSCRRSSPGTGKTDAAVAHAISTGSSIRRRASR